MKKWIDTIDKLLAEELLEKFELYFDRYDNIVDKYKNREEKQILIGKDINNIYNKIFNLIEWMILKSSTKRAILKFPTYCSLAKDEQVILTTRMCLSCSEQYNNIENNIYFIDNLSSNFSKIQLFSLCFEIVVMEQFLFVATDNVYFFINDGYSIDVVRKK